MGFEALLGNERLKENLRRSIGRGRISHFYLISGPDGAGKRTLAKLLAAAILCQGSDRPCGSCPACRKVLGSGHPDYITVDDPEKKTVPVDLIRQARADIYIQPNEADRKIYLFPRAHDMGVPGQNALLKVLEEPPAYGVFILLTSNPQMLLPTIRSRCTELALTALPATLLETTLRNKYPDSTPDAISAAVARSGGWLGQAMESLDAGASLPPETEGFLRSYAKRDACGLTCTLASMEKWSRDMFLTSLHQWVGLLESALAYRSGASVYAPMSKELTAGRSANELMDAISILQKTIEYTQSNVSVGALCGYLAWALR